MKALRYFFFRNYQLNVKQRSAIPWLRPLILLSALSGVNVLAVLWICNELWGGAAANAQRELVAKLAAPCWAAFAFAILYYRWIQSGRYLQFSKEFGGETSSQRRLRAWLLVAYAIATICSPAVIGYWTWQRTG